MYILNYISENESQNTLYLSSRYEEITRQFNCIKRHSLTQICYIKLSELTSIDYSYATATSFLFKSTAEPAAATTRPSPATK